MRSCYRPSTLARARYPDRQGTIQRESEVSYRDVESDGGRRAAEIMAELL